MTTDDAITLLAFLTGGALVGIIGAWMDQLLAYIRGH
jgi:hypothetical protein